MTAAPREYATPSARPRRPVGRWVTAVVVAAVAVGGWRLYAWWYAREVARRNSLVVTGTIVRNLEVALTQFGADVGRYPTTAEGLGALVRPPGGSRGWTGPYVKSLPPDVWGNPYTYTLTGGFYRVGSAGPDGKPGTGDDVFRAGPPPGLP